MPPSSERCSTHLRVTLLGAREPTLSLPWINGSYMTQVINSMILQACLERVVPMHMPRNKAIREPHVSAVRGFVVHRLEFEGDAASTMPATPVKKAHDKLLKGSFIHSTQNHTYHGNFEFLTVCSPEFGCSQCISPWAVRLLRKLCGLCIGTHGDSIK